VKRLIVCAVLAVAAFVAYGIYRAGLDEAPPPPNSTDITFHHGVATGHRIATPSWTASYERIVSNQDQSVLDLYNVTDGTIFKNGAPYLYVRCAELTVNTVTRDFTATGPLHVEMAHGPRRSFETTSAIWNDGLQQLTLAHHTLIHSASLQPLSVASLTFDVKTGDVQLRGVRGDVRW
jgi:hypothetical protein